MRRRRLAGWVLLVASVIVGGLAWITARGTFHPGFGFEALTVGAALIGTASVVALVTASSLLDRPVVLLAPCVAAAIFMAMTISHLAHDIPGASVGSYLEDRELYSSRLHALWLGGLSAMALFAVSAIGLWSRRQSS